MKDVVFHWLTDPLDPPAPAAGLPLLCYVCWDNENPDDPFPHDKGNLGVCSMHIDDFNALLKDQGNRAREAMLSDHGKYPA